MRDEMTGGLRKKNYTEKVHHLYSSPNVVRMTKLRKNVDKILVGRPEGNRPLENPRHRGDDNIKADLREILLQGVN
jgi:hypothetical protein